MPDFSYQAVDRGGQSTSGTITARDSADAAIKIRALGIYPTSIGGAKAAVSKAAGNGSAETGARKLLALAAPDAGSGKKLGRMQVLLFTREMADLLDAGLPMDRAFSVLIEQSESEPLTRMLTVMQADIRAGRPLSEALLKYPREFPDLYANMVRAGEISGQLASVMLRLAEFMEKDHMRRSQIMAALTYPMVLLTVALLAVTFLLTFVIPKLTAVFKDMGAALPLPTVILLGVSGFIMHDWWALLLGIGAVVIGFRAWVRTVAGRMRFDMFRLQVPLFGKITLKIVSARLVRTLGTLLGGGVPILEAMEISASAVGNAVAGQAVMVARSGVRQGESLHGSMEQAGIFLPVVMHMSAVGEETGRLPAMLLRTAETLDFEVDNTMRRLTSLVEPLVVLLMGGFVGFVVLSILLPIFQVSEIVK